MNVTVMILKRKYIGVGIQVLVTVGQKNPFLVLHVKQASTHNIAGAPEINCTTIY